MYGDSEQDGAGRCNANSVDPSQVSPNMSVHVGSRLCPTERKLSCTVLPVMSL